MTTLRNNASASEPTSAVSMAYSLSLLGYHIIPLKPRSKAARNDNWTTLRLDPPSVLTTFKNSDFGVGLLLGTECMPGVFLTAIDVDVDDQTLINNIGLAFPFEPPSKKGRKGITFIARMTSPAKKRIFRRKDYNTGAQIQVVEFLATGQQTVLPPSIHPDGMQYKWVGPSLLDFKPESLPIFDQYTASEIEIAIKDPYSNIFLLNTMTSNEGRGGGDVHNSTLTAVASLVGHGWPEDVIWSRVRRATLLCGANYDLDEWEQTVRVMVQNAVAKDFDKRSKKEKVHRTVANWLIEEHSKKLCYNLDSRVVIYNDGAYYKHSPSDLRHLIASNYVEPESVSLISSDWKAISDTVHDMALRFPKKKKRRRVCLQNGTFDMDEAVLYPWSPDDYLISRVDFNYDKDATCPVYEEFLNRTFQTEGDDRELSINCFEEFAAHTLFECLDYQKFLVIKGAPATGKSTLLKIVKALHGTNVVTAVSVNEFGNERYRTAMVGCLVNLVTEVQATSHIADDFLKAVTSGDEVQVRYLYFEPQLAQLPTRMIFACNEMFRVRDTSGAIERRMLMLSCDNQVEEEDQDPELNYKLRLELPGIFNRLVVAWDRLKKRKRFQPPVSQKAKIQEFTLENNHVLQWLQERTHQGQAFTDPNFKPNGHAETTTEQSILYIDFAEWMKLNGFKPISSVSFGTRLGQIKAPPGINLKTMVKWIGGKAVRVRAITLLSEGKY